MSTLIFEDAMRITAQDKQNTQRAILASARKLLGRRGLHSVATRDIASDAGIGVGTLFNYYPTKDALAAAVVGEAFDAGRELARADLQHLPPGSTLEADLFTLVAADLRALRDLRGVVRDALEGGLGLFTSAPAPGAPSIREQRLADLDAVLARHTDPAGVASPIPHLYWSLYIGVLSYWAGDASPNQEDTLAFLDHTVRLLAAAVPLTRPSPTGEQP